MGGQVLGGGVIVLVATVLWLVYLLPSLHSRHQFNAAERNAVRLNQALRVLAETSETPREVQLELSARTVHAQQRLARQAAAERESAQLEQARGALEDARAQRAAVRAAPAARRARARRRARLVVTVIGAAAVGLTGWGVWDVVATGSQFAMWSGVAMAVVAALVLRRMSRVGMRATRAAQEQVRQATSLPAASVLLDADDRGWTPRSLPRPLANAAGSRAAAALDEADARKALREAAQEEVMRQRAERLRPAPAEIAAARAAREAPDFAAMGHIDDAEIEAHVRQLLARRAAG